MYHTVQRYFKIMNLFKLGGMKKREKKKSHIPLSKRMGSFMRDKFLRYCFLARKVVQS